MPIPFFNITPLINSIQAGHLILTPNYRLARHIITAWGQYCIEQGLTSWPQPQILALEGWLEMCWTDLVEGEYPPVSSQPKSVIDSHGERLLWHSSIQKDPLLAQGADIPSLAELASQTLQQMLRCRLPIEELCDVHHPGSEAFLRWLEHFKRTLNKNNLLTWEQAQELIEHAFKNSFFADQAAIRLVGFQSLSVLHRDIINAASKDVAPGDSRDVKAKIYLQTCSDDKSEISAAALWAKAQYDANPNQRIGLVFGNLANTQYQILRIFQDTFTPQHCLPGVERAVPPFNLSAGIPLAQTPLLDSAFSLLATQNATRPLGEWCQVLTDPFWGPDIAPTANTILANQPLIIRSHCEVLLRDNNRLTYTPAEFRTTLAEAERQASRHYIDHSVHHSDELADRSDSTVTTPVSLAQPWQALGERVRQQAEKASFCYWADEFAQRLELLGWPGPRALDSIEYQQHQHWLDLLEAFAALNNIAEADNPPAVSANTALTQLKRMAQATVFQAQTRASQVQVLGLLEAAGLHFDQLWIAGMDDQQWPQATSHNPLLPVSLQQRYQLPRSNAGQELTLAKQLLEDFQHNSRHIIFSYALRDGDSERKPSRLLPDSIKPLAFSHTDTQHPLLLSLPSTPLDRVQVNQGPALITGDKPVRGGTAILQAQAGSPFNAFATWRLGAQALAEPTSGLSAIERGNLVHTCLELFWTRFKDQAAVKALDKTELDNALGHVISQALLPLHQSRSDIFGPRFAAIEAQRLKQLMEQWLDIECQRRAFTVLAPEKQLFMSIGGLPLSLRIDRIDQLDDGRVVLIDYKTGDTKIASWAGDRLEEPQLPLYALALPEHVAALCFGQISTLKSVTAKGVSDTPEIIPGIQALEKIGFESWEDALDTWREQLETLASEFIEGRADILFYTDRAMRYQAHLYPLNRWPEITQRMNSSTDSLD